MSFAKLAPVFDWLGSLEIREQRDRYAELSVNRNTGALGWAVLLAMLPFFWAMWRLWPPLSLIPFAAMFAGVCAITLRRKFVVDVEQGVLHVEEYLLGLGTHHVVPLFHLRSIIVEPLQTRARMGYRDGFVAKIDRRVGEPIVVDEARHAAPLITMVEALADAADVRYEYNTRASNLDCN